MHYAAYWLLNIMLVTLLYIKALLHYMYSHSLLLSVILQEEVSNESTAVLKINTFQAIMILSTLQCAHYSQETVKMKTRI